MSDLIPDDYAHLLERPLYGHLGTIRPDDTVQVNPMWFEYDGTNLRFTHTRKRAKFRNLQHNPAMSFSIIDPDNQFRYLELRGRLADVEPDPDGRLLRPSRQALRQRRSAAAARQRGSGGAGDEHRENGQAIVLAFACSVTKPPVDSVDRRL